ncbi:DUF1800 domain-containing protein [Enterovibrio coralii]|uniref:DUF1800 domain-containing protein n=1 Tax=Enterovibrio coralii TaxID=294935 RepID=A0A135I8I7_9GAMM|nr:DUF1800 family protein [Enterovibrio coralii]KXF81769.1 hypothetical protein ATN88_03795 [Enterovibrio coralii]
MSTFEPSQSSFTTFSQASRWLDIATFGPHNGQPQSLIHQYPRDWFNVQIALTPSSHHQQILRQFRAQDKGKIPSRSSRIRAWLDIAFYGEDQLRQRLGYVLSQIFVASDRDATLSKKAEAMAAYNDLLCRHAFDNYKVLLKAVSVSAVMGHYLTMVDNKKGDAAGRKPDENYAREVMQLFSMGLNERNLDGTLKQDADRQPVPCYSEKDIQELARVFTGWVSQDKKLIEPMTTNETFHDRGEKQILGHRFEAGVSAEAEMDEVMEILLQHPSTPPNLCKNLIQKLVTSNPSPAYVKRVASVFVDNGKGVRGDMKAVFWAILSDEEVFSQSSPAISKVREPWLSLVYIYRALNAKPGGNNPLVGTDLVYLRTCNQYPLGSPSVFNFYQPDYAPQGIVSNEGLVAPEMEIVDWSHVIYVHNQIFAMTRLNLQGPDKPNQKQLYVDVESLKAHVNRGDINGFIDEVSMRFFNGQMPNELQHHLKAQFNGVKLNAGKWVQRLLFFALSSPYFHVMENRA